jgi:clathrin heavy chain
MSLDSREILESIRATSIRVLPVRSTSTNLMCTESTDPDKVSVAVKAFITGDMPAELIELLEKIILEPSSFSDNPSLQNLLMLTACKSDRGRVIRYIQELDQYSPDDIAQQCIEVGMFDEAFEIFKKHDNHVEAVNVLIDHIVSIDKAHEFADRVDTPEVWSRVAKAQLDGLRVTDSIESYIRAGDATNFLEVIEIATHAGKDEDLIKFLRMARKTLREVPIDTALAFCFARTNQLPELEDFLRATNVADVEASGDKAYEEGYHEAAKIFYTSISNWAKLATTLVHLEDYQAAVECARKANSVKACYPSTSYMCYILTLFRFGGKSTKPALPRRNSVSPRFAVSTSSCTLKSFPILSSSTNATATLTS